VSAAAAARFTVRGKPYADFCTFSGGLINQESNVPGQHAKL